MIFKDRLDAGALLAESLKKYTKQKDTVVLGLARGGVVVAFAVSQELSLPLDIICVRKLGSPNNPELALGAVTSSGESYFNTDLIQSLGISELYMKDIIQKEKMIAEQRLKLYRKNLPSISLKNKTVLLIDDGLATGATMRASIKTARANGASKIVVAVPVAAPDTALKIQNEADEIVCLLRPSSFMSVGQFYQEFSQVSDEEVVYLLQRKK